MGIKIDKLLFDVHEEQEFESGYMAAHFRIRVYRTLSGALICAQGNIHGDKWFVYAGGIAV